MKKPVFSRLGLAVIGVLLVCLFLAIVDLIYCHRARIALRELIEFPDHKVAPGVFVARRPQERLTKDDVLRRFGKPDRKSGKRWIYAWTLPHNAVYSFFGSLVAYGNLSRTTEAAVLTFDAKGRLVTAGCFSSSPPR